MRPVGAAVNGQGAPVAPGSLVAIFTSVADGSGIQLHNSVIAGFARRSQCYVQQRSRQGKLLQASRRSLP